MKRTCESVQERRFSAIPSQHRVKNAAARSVQERRFSAIPSAIAQLPSRLIVYRSGDSRLSPARGMVSTISCQCTGAAILGHPQLGFHREHFQNECTGAAILGLFQHAKPGAIGLRSVQERRFSAFPSASNLVTGDQKSVQERRFPVFHFFTSSRSTIHVPRSVYRSGDSRPSPANVADGCIVF